MNKYFGVIANQQVVLSVDFSSLIGIELRAIIKRNPEFESVRHSLGNSESYSLLCRKDILRDMYSSSYSAVFKRGMLSLFGKLDKLDSSTSTVYTELCVHDNQIKLMYGESEYETLPLIVFSPLLDFIVDTVLSSVVHSQLSIAV